VRFNNWILKEKLVLNPKYLLGFLFLLVSVLSSIPTNSAFADHDLDKDGISDEVDQCKIMMEFLMM